MSIYTRRGDTGQTSLYGSRERYAKTDTRFVALGTIDELNAHLGLVSSGCTDRRVKRELTAIQQTIFEIGAEIAASNAASATFKLKKSATTRLEKWIDFYWNKLPPLANFILPGGSEAAAQTHIARTVCRRAERAIVRLNDKESVNPNILTHINRLSDYLLALARWVNYLEGVGEIIWQGAKKK
ncbi:cob(I)yrinic acid a,c-diamide adenosyltransferase [Candidatus Microgenomates bacterium]|nr:cob(I)yrinic acid a,c-diamide adenosyltransferase [Candidatus Microgenomates bacterium]